MFARMYNKAKDDDPQLQDARNRPEQGGLGTRKLACLIVQPASVRGRQTGRQIRKLLLRHRLPDSALSNRKIHVRNCEGYLHAIQAGQQEQSHRTLWSVPLP